MKIIKMGIDYFGVCNDQGNVLAMVDKQFNKENPTISFSNIISLHEAKNIIKDIEDYLKVS